MSEPRCERDVCRRDRQRIQSRHQPCALLQKSPHERAQLVITSAGNFCAQQQLGFVARPE